MQLLRTDGIFLFFAVLQLCFWYHIRDIRPDTTIVPEVPGKLTVQALSFGDEAFYFRTLALDIQNTGDSFGRVTSLKEYDYKKLSQWFFLLDTLDDRSDFVPAIASYYYGRTQRVTDLSYVIDYLNAHASRNMQKKWWWLAQAVYLANHRLGDKRLALSLAEKLATIPGNNIPLWARQMPAFIHESLGEKEEALVIIKHILQNTKNIPTTERNFMNYFINERLGYIVNDNKKHPSPSGNAGNTTMAP